MCYIFQYTFVKKISDFPEGSGEKNGDVAFSNHVAVHESEIRRIVELVWIFGALRIWRRHLTPSCLSDIEGCQSNVTETFS